MNSPDSDVEPPDGFAAREEPKCPWCHHEPTDARFENMADGQMKDVKCWVCNQKYFVRAHIEIAFTTWPEGGLEDDAC